MIGRNKLLKSDGRGLEARSKPVSPSERLSRHMLRPGRLLTLPQSQLLERQAMPWQQPILPIIASDQ
ncbi:hypothetical protein Pla123a_49230 [Posidoniimonas polymericola]|uniref:Uncharacterized protein n=1 Tax=Posidoniimonas polymericola TaxID=2528002 RepID=A0A5C5XPL4_9BACT|nr:hypothetical protein [Posidoniimonas polymericola]TWT65166.1 hypothetical protein Pla123a_49230 [Posidoniimonas polymericola]